MENQDMINNSYF